MALKDNSLQQFLRELMHEKPEMTTWPSRTVARWLNDKYFDRFPSIEKARNAVRVLRGKHGSYMRGNHKNINAEFYDPQINYDAPKCLSNEYTPFTIPAKHDKMFVLCDTHIPFHDEHVIRIGIKEAKDRGITTLYLNGDAMDQYWLSYFVKRGMKHPFTYKDEVDAMMWFLDWMQDEFETVFYKFGNHEDRFEMYLNRVPELKSDDYYTLSNRLDLRNRGITVIESDVYVNYGKLKILHGHETGSGKFVPVNMARSLYLKVKQSAICGHGHATSEDTKKKLDGHIITCWSVGCACDLNPPYRPINENNHGFAFVKLIDTDGNFVVDNKRVYDGKIM